MAWEIERKFLVDTRLWRSSSPGIPYRQGYISDGGKGCVRVRIAGDTAFLTVKGPSAGCRRLEFEYPIPLPDAAEMLARLCGGLVVEKTRHRESHAGRLWDIDVFHGENDGLVIAEIELPSVDADFARPVWARQEVSNDPRYSNSHLAHRPYRYWEGAARKSFKSG